LGPRYDLNVGGIKLTTRISSMKRPRRRDGKEKSFSSCVPGQEPKSDGCLPLHSGMTLPIVPSRVSCNEPLPLQWGKVPPG
jgi:hypothetical protein